MERNNRHRLAARAIIMRDDRLLLVNAYGDHRLGLWCAPGGGAHTHASLPDNLAREVHEETGMTVAVGTPVLINEFHDPDIGFHQVDLFFRCSIISGDISDNWQDPDGVVKQRRWFTYGEATQLTLRPRKLVEIAWGDGSGIGYDPLEPILL